jgi:hydroxyacylglutathione hydrolase
MCPARPRPQPVPGCNPILRSVTAVDLRPGVIRYESALWQTTALALHAAGEAVIVDPCISAPEIAAIAADVASRGLAVRGLLITHGDWDHVCGISAFPGVPAIMSKGAAERIASGQAAEEVVRLGAAEGLSWDGAPRADLVFEPGEALQVGPFTVETMALPGHTWCGAGFRVPELELLCVGDYLSAIEFPFVYVSTAAYRATLAALSDALERDPVAHVVPGHGRPLNAPEALAIAHDDLDYLYALKAAVRSALAAGATPEQAVAAGIAVEVPRPAGDDDTSLRRDNAALQLAELAAGA